MQEMQGSDATLSKRAFAELIGVSPSRVSQMITAGLPVEVNGRISVDRGKAWVAANVDQNRRRASIDDDGPVRSSKAKKETAEAEIARLKADRMASNLIDRAKTLRTIEGRARFERDSWIGWVNRVAPSLAAATGAEMSSIVAALDHHVREQLAMLASTPVELS